MGIFIDGELDGLWDDGEYGHRSYTEPAPSDELIAEIEAELGYRLPAAYIELARVRNGGTLQRDCFPSTTAHVWAEDHVAVTGIYAIGRTATYSLCGSLGSAFMISEWGYPAIGVCFADTPTAGHSEFMLDYRACGPQGEPSVIVVDQEDDYRITELAPDFATFIRGLVPAEEFEEDPAEAEAVARATVEHGTFSPIVRRALVAVADQLPNADVAVRAIGQRIVADKGFFALHGDPTSHLMYATMFWLYSQLTTAHDAADFIERRGETDYTTRPSYELMIPSSFVAAPYGFTTGGWAKDFVWDWWNDAVERGTIVSTPDGFRLSADAETGLIRVLRAMASPRRSA